MGDYFQRQGLCFQFGVETNLPVKRPKEITLRGNEFVAVVGEFTPEPLRRLLTLLVVLLSPFNSTVTLATHPYNNPFCFRCLYNSLIHLLIANVNTILICLVRVG